MQASQFQGAIAESNPELPSNSMEELATNFMMAAASANHPQEIKFLVPRVDPGTLIVKMSEHY
jgi:hypothetical protein